MLWPACSITPKPALLGALLNSLPPWCVRFAPRPVIEAAYRQLNRARLEGIER
jgi:hypothetical protein